MSFLNYSFENDHEVWLGLQRGKGFTRLRLGHGQDYNVELWIALGCGLGRAQGCNQEFDVQKVRIPKQAYFFLIPGCIKIPPLLLKNWELKLEFDQTDKTLYAKCLCRFFVSILMSVIRPLVSFTSPSFHDVDNCVYQLACCGAIILFSKSYNFTYNFPAETDVWRLLHLGINLSYIDAGLQPQGQFYNEDGVMVYLV